MSKSTNSPAVAENTLPDLPSATSFGDTVSPRDILLPRIFLLQPLSNFVTQPEYDGEFKAGDLVVATSSEDPAPTFLTRVGEDPATVYVVGREKFAATTANGVLEFQDAMDPDDRDSWEGWFFNYAIPSVEPTLPVRHMLWKTAGAPAARAINTMIQRHIGTGHSDPLPILLSVVQRTSKGQGGKGGGKQYFAPVVRPATPDPDDMAIAVQVRATASALRDMRATENDGPTHDQPGIG